MPRVLIDNADTLQSIIDKIMNTLNLGPIFYSHRKTPEATGVYVFYLEGVCMYVGKANNIRLRLAGHNKKHLFREGGYCQCVLTNHPLLVEYILIGYLDPKLNKHLKYYFDGAEQFFVDFEVEKKPNKEKKDDWTDINGWDRL